MANPAPWPSPTPRPGTTSSAGLQVRITSLVGQSRLSQHQELRDPQSAAEVLTQRGQTALEQAMRDRMGPSPQPGPDGGR